MSKKIILFGVDGLMMPLIKKFAAEGALPNLSKMLEQGAAAELLPFISAWGDVNWVAFLSGQSPGTSWVGQALPADSGQTDNLLARLARDGLRAALVHFPESIDSPAPHLTWSPYWSGAAPCPYVFSAPAIFTTRYKARTARPAERSQTLGWPPSSPLAYHEKGLWQPLEPQAERWRLTLAADAGGRDYALAGGGTRRAAAALRRRRHRRSARRVERMDSVGAAGGQCAGAFPGCALPSAGK